ncbi:MAG: hypothetical protein RBU30_12640 [Polyangia bacterium]|jgi:hypothetical protein|nr:hypothetical protein [Polyangia bacterium]
MQTMKNNAVDSTPLANAALAAKPGPHRTSGRVPSLAARVLGARVLSAAMLAASVLLMAPPARAINVGERAKPFRLQGHDGKWYTLSSFTKRILVMFYEGTKSMEQNARFKDKFTAMYRAGTIKQKNFHKIGFANYMESGIPNVVFDLFIAREMRKKYPGELVLRDRDGTMMRTYGMRNGRSNIYVFNQQRELIWKSSGPLTQKRAEQLLRLLRRITK